MPNTTRGKIRNFCTCHGVAWGTSRDRKLHRGRQAVYEARIRIGSQWLNKQQAARVFGR
jgi:hypothetical protein